MNTVLTERLRRQLASSAQSIKPGFNDLWSTVSDRPMRSIIL